MPQPTAAEKAANKQINDLEKKLTRSTNAQRKMKKQLDEAIAASTQFGRARVLLDNVVRAVEGGDITAMEQTAGAGREFLDTNPA